MTTTLRGITWNHSRGYVPKVATAQRFMETHPGVEITWEKRSLQEFADAPIERLAERYDLLIIDHPWAGFAADKGILVPLEQHVSAAFLADQAQHSVGRSHESYLFDGVQTAFAVDAATPVASYRQDLLAAANEEVPQSWDELLALAKKGRVAFAGIPVDALMNFYMLCVTQGEEPCNSNDEQVVSEETGVLALELLRELTALCPVEMLQWNPIRVYEAMSSGDGIAYCPFAYGYSNYARAGYARHLLHFTDMVSLGSHGRLRSTLGGTGIGVSARCTNTDLAVEFAAYIASPEIQRTVFAENGGQPGHRAAWDDVELNRRTNGYFLATLPALDRAYLRPRYSGYLEFQDHAGDAVRDYIISGGRPQEVLERLNGLYRSSRMEASK
ncbi:extracellular solute-binding protein [Paenibacillus sp. CF384]|uniref:extracellular solute-binding protein n=1 Tax=Paenibacillus sp. CF384 TaxID=1884382 RepID=UPI0008973815|nr:extracellular solute-binding protein [Paenibacillus sp. CF384]SDW20681.1 carbohydrate ABC transporter substrate-binding protein, CUT1 family [Paenibacillus sp. CF384]